MGNKKQQPPPNAERGLPADILAEKSILGAILKGGLEVFTGLAIAAEDFSLHDHQTIFRRMQDLAARAEKIDKVTLAGELAKHEQLQPIGGITYLLELDNDFIPGAANVDAYVRAVQEKARLRKLIQSFQKGIDEAFTATEDSAEIAGGVAARLGDIQASARPQDDDVRSAEKVVVDFQGGIDAFLDPTKRARGLPTGFTKFDEMTGGLKEGEMIIIAARPSHGKSAISLNIAQHLSIDPQLSKFVAFFSLEMSAESLILRMACSVGRVDMHKFRGGWLNADERHRLQYGLHQVMESRIKFDDTANSKMGEICGKIRRLVNDEGLHLAIIDYLGLVAPDRQAENKNQEVTVMSRQIKMLAKELRIPIIVLCQLSRQTDRRGDPRPQLSDLRDSGSLEQDADVVAFIFREEMHKRDREDLRGLAELIIAKQRDGPIGSVQLRFLNQFVRFENRIDELEEPQG